MLAWGRAAEGQLGLGGIEEVLVSTPTLNKRLNSHRVREVACGRSHMVALMESGEVMSCGSNESGQLGQDSSTTRPATITLGAKVTQVACGHSHSVALTAGGEVYAWGDNSFGQLGDDSKDVSPQPLPKLVQELCGPVVVQIACGAHHTMALLRDGRLFSWGYNAHGQLAHSIDVKLVAKPTRILKVDGLPIVRIAAGGDQSFVLSVSGAVYGWGRNDSGQLGIGHLDDTGDPTELSTLRTQKVKYIACGTDHTAVLTQDGGVFTFGSGRYGQLGHNSTQSVSYPTKVFELMGSIVSQIACGRCHTLAVVKTSGRLLSFGLGGSGQLGTKYTANQKTPTPVHGMWLAPPTEIAMETDAPDLGTSVDQGYMVKRVFAGGDQSYATLLSPTDHEVFDGRVIPTSHTTFFLEYERVKEVLDHALITKDFKETNRVLSMVFSFPSCLNGAFLARDHQETSGKHSGVDISSAIMTFNLIERRLHGTPEEGKIRQLLCTNLLPVLPPQPLSMECARLYYLLPALIFNPPELEAMVAYMKAFLTLDPVTKSVIGNWLFTGPRNYTYQWLNTLKTLLTGVLVKSKQILAEQGKNLIAPDGTHQVLFQQMETDMMKHGLEFLKCIHNWNIRHGEVFAYDEFHLKLVSEVVDLVADYFNWIEKKEDVLIFCQYPFLLDAQAKAELMKVESKFRQHLAVTHAQRLNIHGFLTQGILSFSPLAFELVVRRDNLVNDTLRHLMNTDEKNFKKPLRVTFMNEEGLDAGGVQKEFFMLLLQEILNPDFGMFVEDPESHLLWFRDQALHYERLDHFALIGILCGLAIYNTVIIDLPFPTALYKKLLNRPPDLSDLTELRPLVGHNLLRLLDYEGEDFDEKFGLYFELSRSSFGTTESVDLIPGGSKIPVTKDTRQDYVHVYVKYVMTDSVKDPYGAFARGFLRVCGGEVLNLFHHKELMALVIGNQVQDWSELEKYVEYRNGYTADHPSIKLFWKVFSDLPVEVKKKFLVFLTGSNRIPIAGVKSMKMMIQKMDGGPGCERLPVAHTCFNILDLPPYSTEETMKQKLLQCVNFTAGFGIV